MALATSHTWNPGDILKSVDLNGVITNILTQPIALISPTTGPIDFNFQLHKNLLPSVLTGTSGSSGQVLTVTSSGGIVLANQSAGGGSSPFNILAAQIFGG